MGLLPARDSAKHWADSRATPHLACRTVATEWHLYIVSPLIMWAAYCPRRAAPRRFGLAGLAAATLVQPAIMGVLGATGSDPEHWVSAS